MKQNFIINEKISKNYVFNNVSQEQIFSYYLGETINVEKTFLVPTFLRFGDDSPSLAFYYNSNGKLRAKDLGGDFNGDCLDFVGKRFNLNVNNKEDFKKILHIICRDFNLNIYKNSGNIVNPYKGREIIEIKKSKIIFSIEFRKYNHYDTTWWDLRVSEDDLNFHRVYPIQYLWNIESTIPIYSYSMYDPCYGYYIGRNKDGIDEWKFYFPKRPKHGKLPRFISNSSNIQGICLLKKSNFGIITKSYKDVVALSRFSLEGENLRGKVVATSAESVFISKKQVEYLHSFWETIIINYDYDKAGLKNMAILRRRYGFTPAYIKDGDWRINTKSKIKDFTDFLIRNTDNECQNLITNTYYKIFN